MGSCHNTQDFPTHTKTPSVCEHIVCPSAALSCSLSPPCFMVLIDCISSAILSMQPNVLWLQISQPNLTWVCVRDVTVCVFQSKNIHMIRLLRQMGYGRDSEDGWADMVLCSHLSYLVERGVYMWRGQPMSAEEHY